MQLAKSILIEICLATEKKNIKYEIAKSDIREKFDEFLCRRHTYLCAQRFTIVSRLNSENDCYDANGKEYMEKYLRGILWCKRMSIYMGEVKRSSSILTFRI